MAEKKKHKGAKSSLLAMILDTEAPDVMWRHALCCLAVSDEGEAPRALQESLSLRAREKKAEALDSMLERLSTALSKCADEEPDGEV